ncbi:hypothetical protein J7J59_02905 [Candidatus Aerophobetes bacterium]|nr:hypothetical protein [Candidatus Aerophobetes bacterium]
MGSSSGLSFSSFSLLNWKTRIANSFSLERICSAFFRFGQKYFAPQISVDYDEGSWPMR